MIHELYPTATPKLPIALLPEKCNGRPLATPYTPQQARRLSLLIAGHAHGRELAWRIAGVANPRDVEDNDLLYDLATRLARLAEGKPS